MEENGGTGHTLCGRPEREHESKHEPTPPAPQDDAGRSHPPHTCLKCGRPTKEMVCEVCAPNLPAPPQPDDADPRPEEPLAEPLYKGPPPDDAAPALIDRLAESLRHVIAVVREGQNGFAPDLCTACAGAIAFLAEYDRERKATR